LTGAWDQLLAELEAVLPSARYVSDERHCMSAWAMPSTNGHGDGGDHTQKEKISVIGSGNWGSVAAKLVATNARSQSCFHGMQVGCIVD